MIAIDGDSSNGECLKVSTEVHCDYLPFSFLVQELGIRSSTEWDTRGHEELSVFSKVCSSKGRVLTYHNPLGNSTKPRKPDLNLKPDTKATPHVQ